MIVMKKSGLPFIVNKQAGLLNEGSCSVFIHFLVSFYSNSNSNTRQVLLIGQLYVPASVINTLLKIASFNQYFPD